MADKNSVIIQETYCTNIGSFYWDASRQLEEAMQKYLSILEDILLLKPAICTMP